MQIETGIRAILANPLFYKVFRGLLGTSSYQEKLSSTYLKIGPTDTVLDYGCGPGVASLYPDSCSVVGYDVSSDYVAHATRTLGGPKRLFTTDLAFVAKHGPYDVAIAIGVLHHLSDSEARAALRLMIDNLKPGGRLVTVDNVFVTGQSPIARWLIQMDRGQNVREVAGYRALFDDRERQVKHDVRHDLLKIPYTHIIIEATKI